MEEVLTAPRYCLGTPQGSLRRSSARVSTDPDPRLRRVTERRGRLVGKSPMPGTSCRASTPLDAPCAGRRRGRLFTEHGYAATSLDAIVAGADVTKGALYHHYSGKQALFEAVFERVESAGAQSIQDALPGDQDPWDKALSGLRAFLEVVRQPSYSRIVIQDGRRCWATSGSGSRRSARRSPTSSTSRAVLTAGVWTRRRDGAHFAGSSSVRCRRGGASRRPKTPTPRPSGGAGDRFILSGLRSLADQGVQLAAPTS